MTSVHLDNDRVGLNKLLARLGDKGTIDALAQPVVGSTQTP